AGDAVNQDRPLELERPVRGEVDPGVEADRHTELGTASVDRIATAIDRRDAEEPRLEDDAAEAEVEDRPVDLFDRAHRLAGAGAGEATGEALRVVADDRRQAVVQLLGVRPLDLRLHHAEVDAAALGFLEPVLDRAVEVAEETVVDLVVVQVLLGDGRLWLLAG